jgi:hypothetical protein
MECNKCAECEGKWHHFAKGKDQDRISILECIHCQKRVSEYQHTVYLESSAFTHHFFFKCEACDCAGVLSVEANRISQRVYCPENCGAIYVLFDSSITKAPDLKCVIKPMHAVYEEPAYGE